MASGLPVAKIFFLWNIRDIVRFYCITTGSNNSNMISIIEINIWIVLNKVILILKKLINSNFFPNFLCRFGEKKSPLSSPPLRVWQNDGRFGGGLDNVEYGINSWVVFIFDIVKYLQLYRLKNWPYQDTWSDSEYFEYEFSLPLPLPPSLSFYLPFETQLFVPSPAPLFCLSYPSWKILPSFPSSPSFYLAFCLW